MEKSTQDLLVKLALVGGGLYLLWKLITGLGGAAKDLLNSLARSTTQVAQQATAPVANVLAQPIIWWTAKPPINLAGKIVLQPSGQIIDPSTVDIAWEGDIPTMTLGGVKYILGPHDASGNFPAINMLDYLF